MISVIFGWFFSSGFFFLVYFLGFVVGVAGVWFTLALVGVVVGGGFGFTIGLITGHGGGGDWSGFSLLVLLVSSF